MKILEKILNTIYHNKIFERVFPTQVYLLKKALMDCDSVLDLGCGCSSPLQWCDNIKYSVGVEIYTPYLLISKKQKIHTHYLNKDILKVEFDENQFDAVLMIEVIEHLKEDDVIFLLKKAEKWAKKKIIITTPNGFLNQKLMDNNLYQHHLSGWDYSKMLNLGFQVYGLAGLKSLRSENQSESMVDSDLFSTLKFKPKIFWFIISAVSQSLAIYFPKKGFELFCIKKILKKRKDN